MSNYDIRILFLIFIFYSFLGWCYEVIKNLVTSKKMINRGFLIGPWIPIYGVGAVILIFTLRYFKKNNYTLFFGGCLVGSTIEYIISFLGEALFDARWWDYTGRFLNINGRICLLYAIFWGILSLMLVKIINPRVDKLINYIKNKINLNLLKTFVIIGTVFMTFNAIASSIAMQYFLIRMSVENSLDVKNKEKVYMQYVKIYGNEKRSELIHKYWGNKKMITTYPNVTLKLDDETVVYVKNLLPEIQPYFYKFK